MRWYPFLTSVAAALCFIALIAYDVIRIADTFPLSLPYIWVIGNGLIVGSLIWALTPSKQFQQREPADAPMGIKWYGDRMEVPGSIKLGDFLARVTMHTPEGKVFLWGSAANIGLGLALAFTETYREDAMWAIAWPFALFLLHIGSFVYGYLESRWFRLVILVAWASIPSAKVVNHLFAV